MNRRQEPLRVSLAAITKPFADWITGATGGRASGFVSSAALVSYTYDRKETYRLKMQDALLSEVMLDGVDAASDALARFDLVIHPGASVHQFAGDNASVMSAVQTRLKSPSKANFALFIKGLEAATTRVSSIDTLGARRTSDGPWSATTLALSLPLAHAGPLYQWMDETLLGAGKPVERPGVLQLLDPTLRVVLASLDYQALGITRISGPITDVASDRGPRVAVELRGRGLTFNLAGLT